MGFTAIGENTAHRYTEIQLDGPGTLTILCHLSEKISNDGMVHVEIGAGECVHFAKQWRMESLARASGATGILDKSTRSFGQILEETETAMGHVC